LYDAPMRTTYVLLLLTLVAVPVQAQDTLPADLRGKIDAAVEDALATTGAPSASIAVVRDGQIAYTHAYGTANLESKAPATTAMRYSIGSISKQFCASALLMLAEEGKLSLDDKVSRFLPDLTRAGEVTIRELLSMTSGYQDYWPQDYVMPGMLKPTTAEAILERWARIPLDFEPGTAWQYSNTNYVIAGLIVEKAAGKPLYDLLGERVFSRLGMSSVANVDVAPLGPDDPARYTRYGTGPVRPAPKEGAGWIFAAGELAMTASDLAKWDVSLIDHAVLAPDSYKSLETEMRLSNGAGTGYGLGVAVRLTGGHRVLLHGGEVSGFTAENLVYPDDRLAVVVLTNLDATNASGEAAEKIASLLLAPAGDGPTVQARRIFDGLQHGRVNRSLFTDNANFYFSPQVLQDLATSLGPLGSPTAFTAEREAHRGGMVFRSFNVTFSKRTLRITTFTLPDGKLEQFIARPQ
jgi:D-alanyl-D-alanine carboxypeptidase